MRLVCGQCVASVVARLRLYRWLRLAQFFSASYKWFDVTRLVTQPPRHIIKHIILLSLRIDDSLSTNRLTLLSSIVGS